MTPNPAETPDDFSTSAEYAATLDKRDPLAHLRQEFAIPPGANGEPKTYLVGNSLGALPLGAKAYVAAELDRWATLGVDGHFTGTGPGRDDLAWEPYHELLTDQLGAIVGAHGNEVVAMNALTVNLHLLMVSFYQPTAERHKILIEDHAFPSDHFAVESQIRQRGFDPADSLVVASPRPGEETLRHEDLFELIEANGAELALILLPGVQYYTGQVLPMADITRAGHAVGAPVGFDLAHAVGNVVLDLHDWGVDFAAWCSYKYLNGGPGGVGGAYVHNRHIADQTLPKFLGWWGTNKSTRFEMTTDFDPIPTVESWQLSNAPILSMAALRASLDVIDRAGGVGALRHKSEQQISYLDAMLEAVLGDRIESITPTAIDQRGCQFALRVTAADVDGRAIYERLEEAHVACDWRYPDVIRVAPVPLYNSFADIHQFVHVLDQILIEAGA